jgi:hypothetical protein
MTRLGADCFRRVLGLEGPVHRLLTPVLCFNPCNKLVFLPNFFERVLVEEIVVLMEVGSTVCGMPS